jgi:hypothetical protein
MAALPHKAFSGKVESGCPSENAVKSMKHFQESSPARNSIMAFTPVFAGYGWNPVSRAL